MPYKTLYQSRQKHPEHLPRKWYLEDALNLQWVKGIKIKAEPLLKQSVLKGFIYRSGICIEGGIPFCDYTIILAGDLPIEQERFVTIKELMHCYFDPQDVQYATDSAVALDNHFRQFFGDSSVVHDSRHVQAEARALWMALGVICPEHIRTQYLETATPPQAVAKALNIPEKQAKNLLSKQFDSEIRAILN